MNNLFCERLVSLRKMYKVSQQKVAPEFNQEQLQVVELIKKLNSKELEKVYNYLLGIIDAKD